MAKYKRWEQPFVKSLDSDSQRAVRHSRKPLHGGRGVVCEECSDPLPPAHPFYCVWLLVCALLDGSGWLQRGALIDGEGV